MAAFVAKGSRIRAAWQESKAVPLAGMTLKFQVTERSVTGVVRHVRGDAPVNPTQVRFYVDPEGSWDGPRVRPPGCTCEQEHVEVDPKHVIGLVAV